jgi:hypothetical protein
MIMLRPKVAINANRLTPCLIHSTDKRAFSFLPDQAWPF